MAAAKSPFVPATIVNDTCLLPDGCEQCLVCSMMNHTNNLRNHCQLALAKTGVYLLLLTQVWLVGCRDANSEVIALKAEVSKLQAELRGREGDDNPVSENIAVSEIRALYVAMRERGNGIFRLADDSHVSHITYGGFELRVFPGADEDELRARVYFTSYLFDKQRAFWRPNPEIIGVALKWSASQENWQYVDMLTRSGELWQRVYGKQHAIKFPVRPKEEAGELTVAESESNMFPLMDHFGADVHRAQQIAGVTPDALLEQQGLDPQQTKNTEPRTGPILLEQDYEAKTEWDRFVKVIAKASRNELKVIHQEPVIGMATDETNSGVVFFFDKDRSVVLRAEFERGARERFPMDWALQRVWESEGSFDDYLQIDMARVTYRYPVSDFPFSRNKINALGLSANIALTKGR